MDPAQAEGWRELEHVPVEITNFAWRPSSFEEGHKVFVVVKGTRLDDGSSVVLTTGSGNVMGQLIALARLGKLPGAVREYHSEKTAGGFNVGWLRTPEKIKAERQNARLATDLKA